jgi:hypothetical protein
LEIDMNVELEREYGAAYTDLNGSMREVAEAVYAKVAAGMREQDIPGYMRNELLAYVMDGRPMGGFLLNVFENNLLQTFSHADESNAAAVRGYAHVIYNYVPMASHGGEKEVHEWMKHRGLLGTLKLQMRPQES